MVVAQLKRYAKKSKTALIAHKIYENWRMKKRFSAGYLESLHGSTHSGKALSESLKYVDDQFEDYLRYSGLSANAFRGRRVFELGFGDNVGVALKFLAGGATQVVCLDKFYSKRDLGQHCEIYRALRESLRSDDERRQIG